VAAFAATLTAADLLVYDGGRGVLAWSTELPSLEPGA